MIKILVISKHVCREALFKLDSKQPIRIVLKPRNLSAINFTSNNRIMAGFFFTSEKTTLENEVQNSLHVLQPTKR